MIKAVTFFLIGMMILGLMGRLRLPGGRRLSAAKCPKCGRYQIGRDRCDCARKGS